MLKSLFAVRRGSPIGRRFTNDFDVRKWATPEFLEQAAKELLDERWKKVTAAKLPETSALQASARRLG